MRVGLSAPVVGVAYLLALAVQVSMNVNLVVTNSAGSRLDLLGFAVMMAIGFLLAVHEIGRRTLRIRPALYCAAFAGHLALVIGFTSQTSLLATFLSKYGIFTWTLAGAFAALAIDSVARKLSREQGRGGLWSRIALVLPVLMLGILLLRLRDYLGSPFPIELYQFGAANLTVLLIASLLAAFCWSSSAKKASVMAQGLMLMAIGTVLTYLVSRMNSTSIVLVWSLLAPIYLYASGMRLDKFRALLLVFFALAGLVWATGTGAFAAFIENTRFREIAQGGTMLSSLSNRLELIPTFWNQFAISPLFGNYEAEVLAGYQPGEYVHSTPLSLLTHSGVVGGLLFFAATFSLLKIEIIQGKNDRNQGRVLARAFFYVVLAVATLSTFFTWIPLWFMIGFLLVRPRERLRVSNVDSTRAPLAEKTFL